MTTSEAREKLAQADRLESSEDFLAWLTACSLRRDVFIWLKTADEQTKADFKNVRL